MKIIPGHRTGSLGMTFIVSVLLSARGVGAGQDQVSDKHLMLRNDTAVHYFEPESHLKLARYHYDLGHKIQAFYISEYARKVFGDEKFDQVFDKVAAVKMKVSPQFEDETEFSKYCQAHPGSPEACAWGLGEKLKIPMLGPSGADNLIQEALSKYPQHLIFKSMAARYYLKAQKDEEKALPLYVDLYFNDPHFYDGEFAEGRVKQISSARKGLWWSERVKSGEPFAQLCKAEDNPRVFDVATDHARKQWDSSMVQGMLTLLDNDDPSVQASALHTLLAHPDDIADEVVRKMLTEKDYIKRAMASFLVMKCLGDAEYALLKDNLDCGIDLVQLDTIQALGQMGGPKGIAFLKSHPPAKASDRMKDMWQAAIAQE